MSSSELVRVEVELINSTDQSHLFSNGYKNVWIPISQIDDESTVEEGYIDIPEWLAINEGLI